ncbi:MAG TPA: FAD:protein FMN transferase [Phycisphaerae bacterium]|nr:FAD:protein FMN transferase [Phycisphaerae bacterium]
MSPHDAQPAGGDESARPARNGWLLVAGPLIAGAAIVAVLWLLWGAGAEPKLYRHSPRLLMSTDCEITIVLRADQRRLARRALQQAERALRDVEARMSVYTQHTELWNLNAAPAGRTVPLSPQTLEALRASRELHAASRGAFDVTVLPLVRLWKQAGRNGRLPTEAQIAAARAAATWEQITLLEDGAVKDSNTACVDLGGIAKGYAVDRAVEALKGLGVPSGIVNLGGNLRCFGRRADGEPWQVDVRDPFAPSEDKAMATLHVADAAVCTSAHYHRFSVIGGRRYSHILDPATGRPTERTASVTVVAPTCMQADGWATALSVLGPEGLKLLPNGMEAMLVVGEPATHKTHATEGFRKHMAEGPGD